MSIYCEPLDSGVDEFCGFNTGGIVEAYIADFDKVNSIVVGSQSVVSAITMVGSSVYHKFDFREDTGSFDQTNTPSLSSDSVEQVGTLVFPKLDTAKNNTFNLLRGKRLSVIYLDSNEQYWLSGYKRGVRLTNMEVMTGTNRTDENQYTLTFTAVENYKAFEVEESVIATITT